MKHIVFTLIALFSFSVSQTKHSSAQMTFPFLPPEQVQRFYALTSDDGLSQNLVLFIHQDRQGFLWFGTAGGLNRYDGIELKTYNAIQGLQKQPVYFYSLIENPDSTFWIGTEFGLLLFDPVSVSGKMFVLPESMMFPGAANDIHHMTRLRNGFLLFGLTGKGLLQFDTKEKKFSLVSSFTSLKSELPREDIAGITPLNNGDALVVTYEQILLYDSRQQTTKRLAVFSNTKKPNCVWFDEHNERVLIGTSSGVFQFKNSILARALFSALHQSWLDSIPVHAIYGDRQGTLWLGTENGIAAVRENEQKVIYYPSNPSNPSGIPIGTVLALYEDRSGNLWISVKNHGVYRIDLKKKKFFSITNRPGFPRQLMSDLVWDIEIDREGNLLVAGNGITSVDRQLKKVTFISPAEGSSESYLRKAQYLYPVNDSFICIIADRGLFRYDKKISKGKRMRINGLPVDNVYLAFMKERSKTLLCVSRDSIFEIDPVRERYIGTILRFTQQSLLPSIAIVDNIVEDSNGTVWFGTSYGLLRYNETDSSFFLISDTTRSTVVLPDPTVTSLAFSSGNILWIGTTSGLYRYDTQRQTMRGFHVNDGLPNDKIWSLAIDSKANIWASSNRGLMRLRELPDGTLSIRSYTVDDRLPSNEFSMGVVSTDAHGTFYFGTPNGVLYFHPDSVMDNPYVPPIVLTDLKIYGVSVPLDREISFTTTLTIPFEKKVFSVRYVALEFTDPARNRYMYKMEGYDDRWVEAGGRLEAFYTNLDPGNYTLLIKASNNDDVWNEKPLAVTIEIAPPFWMTWWFRGILVFSAIVLIGGIIRFWELRRIRRRLESLERQQALERERSRISKDMHDEVGSSLTKIAILSELAKLGESSIHLEKISTTSREVIDNISQIIWAINPKNDKLENMTAYLREYISETFEMADIRCVISFPDEFPLHSLSAEYRRNIFLTIKEAVNNIVKYSKAGEVHAALNITENELSFSIKDNGIGFNAANPSQFGNGLHNMKKRIEDIGGIFTIDSAEGKGTESVFRVPITTFV